MNTSVRSRVLILGLDGATFDVLDPLIARGFMPHLATLIRQGCRSILCSTDPYVTAPAWTSIVTGKRPDTHGVLDWTAPVPGQYRRRLIDSRFRRDQAFWEILAARNVPAGSINLPLSYPPDTTSSFSIGDMFTPSRASSYTHPQGLKKDLESLGYRIDIRKNGYFHRGYAPFVRDLMSMTRARGQAIRLCLDRYPWQAAIAVFVGPDRLQHAFWPRVAEVGVDAPEHRMARSYFQCLDQEIGAIVSLMNRSGAPPTQIYVVSDHGFGAHTGAFYINDWLVSRRYLKYHPSWPGQAQMRALARRTAEAGNRLLHRKRRVAPGSAIDALHGSSGPGRAVPVRRSPLFGESLTARGPSLDWAQTVAFADTPHGVRLNVVGREPCGTVSPEDVTATLERIAEDLLDVRDPETGLPIHSAVVPRDARYCGVRADLAPDLVYTFRDPGYSWRIGSLTNLPSGRVVPGGYLAKDLPWELGTHRPEGILICAGPDILAGSQGGPVDTWDLVPTLLYHLGHPIPPDLEGRVLREVMRPEVLAERPEVWGGSPAVRPSEIGEAESGAAAVSDADREKVADHLRSLGYLA